MRAPLRKKKQIGKFLSTAAENVVFQRVGTKPSNHSVPISRLLDADIPENFIAQLSGHKNIQTLQSYKSGSEQHQRQMSNILSRTHDAPNQSSPSSNSVDLHPDLALKEASRGQSMTFESMQQLTTTHFLAVTQASTSDAKQPTISNLQWSSKIIQGKQKRRRAVIESDNED